MSISKWHRLEEIEKRRKETPCFFFDGISRSDFNELVNLTMMQTKRVKSAVVEDAVVKCVAESQSGHSEWSFSVDFNDWGHVTGKRWTWSENSESSIPASFGNMLAEHIREEYERKRIYKESFGDLINDYATLVTEPEMLYLRCPLSERVRNRRKIIEIQYQQHDLIGEHIYSVISALKKNGFCNLRAIPQKDVDDRKEYYLFEVGKIEIDGKEAFEKGDWFRKNTLIDITYHIKKEIAMPYSSTYFRGKNYENALEMLADLGYTNIDVRPIRDLVKGWLVKDGSVDRVVVGGRAEEPIMRNRIYEYDTKIVVCYHTF